jgi:hypothetical protein
MVTTMLENDSNTINATNTASVSNTIYPNLAKKNKMTFTTAPENTATDYSNIYKTIYAEDFATESTTQYNDDELALEVV